MPHRRTITMPTGDGTVPEPDRQLLWWPGNGGPMLLPVYTVPGPADEATVPEPGTRGAS